MFNVGDVIAEKYQVERVLGQGGMGVVLAARHLHLGDLVAIKLILPELVQNQEVLGRFVNEAKVARMLKSPHAGKVLDVGVLQPQNAPYIVMEFLEGEDLGKRLETFGPFALQHAVDCIMQACVALAEAHSHGIVHRDIKPSNLFLTVGGDGQPCIKVLDFGIAKLGSDSSQKLTRTRGLVGSAIYASPEQINSSKGVDFRTDIWSLGVSFFEIMTGQFPFAGDDIAMLAVSIYTQPPKAIHSLRPDLPAEFQDILGRWLQKERSQRFNSVLELAQRLAPYGTDASVIALRSVTSIFQNTPASKWASLSASDPLGAVIPAPALASNPTNSGSFFQTSPNAGLQGPTGAITQGTHTPTSNTNPGIPGKGKSLAWLYVLIGVLVVGGVGIAIALSGSSARTGTASQASSSAATVSTTTTLATSTATSPSSATSTTQAVSSTEASSTTSVATAASTSTTSPTTTRVGPTAATVGTTRATAMPVPTTKTTRPPTTRGRACDPAIEVCN